MSSADAATDRCPQCGAPQPATEAAGPCPACALRAALHSSPAPDQALSLHDIPLPGESVAYIGDYELLGVIAQGGMGVVYRARQRSLNRLVALKLLLGGAHASDEYRRRFRIEAETAARLQHPNIVPVYEVGEHRGLPFLAMEYVAGSDLAVLTRESPLAPARAATYVQALAGAVQYAHEQGVLHRDLKPSNILVGPDDRPRISDFGLARQVDAQSRLTLSHATLGTPGYMSPEQAVGRADGVKEASDIYGLGALLYHLLTGRPPFAAETVHETLRQVVEVEPASPRHLNPAVPRDLETVILKCLRKEPERRYASARALAEDLGRFLRGEPVLARPVGWGERAAKWYRRQPVVAWLATTVLVTILAGSVISYRQARTARIEAAKSRQVAGFLQRMLESVRPSVALGRDTRMLQEILDTAAGRVATELGGSPEVDAHIRHVLGRSYSDLGDYTNAIALLRGSLERRREAGIERHPDTADLQEDLANALALRGEVAEAEKMQRSALALRRALFGPEHLSVAVSLSGLAGTLRAQARLKEAEELHREALALMRRLTSNTDPEISTSLNNLAQVLRVQGQLQEAESAQREAIALAQAGTSQAGPTLAALLDNLAVILGLQGRRDEAEGLHRQALGMRREFLPPDHPDLGKSLNNLANVLRGQGKLTEAEVLQREAVDILRRRLGTTNATTAAGLTTLGAILQAQKKLPEAEAVFQEGVELLRRCLPPDHPDIAISLGTFGTVLRDAGKLAEAETVLREGLDRQRARFNDPGIAVPHLLHALGTVTLAQGRVEEAEPLLREALKRWRVAAGERHPNTPTLARNLAKALRQQGRWVEAEQVEVSAARGLAGLGGIPPAATNRQAQVDALSTLWRSAPTNAPVLLARAALNGRFGDWAAAAVDLTEAQRLDPQTAAFPLAPLQAHLGDLAGYSNQCERAIHLAGSSRDPDTLAAATLNLLLAPHPTRLQAAAEFATRLAPEGRVPATPSHSFQLALALTALRQGHLDEANERSQALLETAPPQSPFALAAGALQVLCRRAMNDVAGAGRALEAVSRAEPSLPAANGGDWGELWPEWLIAQALLAEARSR